MVEINVKISARSPLNIGAGAQQGTLAQQGMVKDTHGWPYIPASSLKGKWRHAVEQVARSLEMPEVCTTNDRMCRRQDPCIVCQIFGSPWSPGKLHFANLVLSGPPVILTLQEDPSYYPRTVERTGVAINRQRRVAEDHHLYNTELFWPGIELEFSGILRGDISQRQAALLQAGLRLLTTLGRGNTGGLGWVAAETVFQYQDGIWTNQALHNALKTGGGL
ncbi:MAG: hypothetical protein H6659_06510 [Ardenticatenaceae bacterium]|nr:hypothetical protein [Ardenticatenaceae bacterium]